MDFKNDMDFAIDMSFDNDIDNSVIEPLYPEFEIESKFKNDLNGFIKRDFEQRERFRVQTDADYYTVIVFQNGLQRQNFLKALKINHLLYSNHFINGLKASEILNIPQDKIELSKAKFRKNFTNDYI